MPETDAMTRRRQRTVTWVVALSTIVLVFDGYDLVVYGTVLSTLLADPAELGAITPGQAGALGSYALIGVLVGALAAGSLGDWIGRRRIMLINLAWFSIGMGATALTQNYPTRARAAGVAWCAGFGRIGGIVGPVVGGLLVGAGLGGTTTFYLFAAIATVAAVVTVLVPRSRHAEEELPVAAPAAGSPHPA
ncbi:MFS transporter [Saccharopolyspora shandongensis]|uniref:MFS transporter n=1 Tax=Saccharopolyspora shandongensis TaxID=418495 RepID=UPI0033CD0D6D